MTQPQQPTDAALVARMRTGDAAVSDELYRRNADDVRRAARVVARGDDEVEVLVGEAFARVFAQIRAGAEPDDELRPYLRTVVRRLAIVRYRAAALAAGAADPATFGVLPEPDAPITVAAHQDLVRLAYETLPAEWQQVLWRTEVERRTPVMLAGSYGSNPNALAALAYRAREGLRQAYLSLHATGSMRRDCQPFVPMIPSLTRGTLAETEEEAITAHLAECTECRARRDEMAVLMSDLPDVLLPALLGFGAPARPARPAAPAGAPAGRGSGRPRGVRQRSAAVAAVVAAAVMLAAVAVVAVAMVSSMLGTPPVESPAAQPEVAPSAPPGEAGSDRTGEDGPVPGPAEATITAYPAEPHDDEPEASGIAPSPGTNAAPEGPAAGRPADPAPSGPAEPAEPPSAERSQRSPPSAERSQRSPSSAPPAEDPAPDPTTAATGPAGPAPPGSPPWLCDLVPGWPGCPDDPEPPGRGALCARLPDLPFCPAG
jgi:DNA-directed RNA polymerase specialized sigma24 family protein